MHHNCLRLAVFDHDQHYFDHDQWMCNYMWLISDNNVTDHIELGCQAHHQGAA